MALRPAVIRDQDKIDVRLTAEAEYLIPFTFIEALNEGTLFDRPAHAFLEAARERRLFHVLNRTTDNILGTGIIQASGDEKSSKQAEVGGPFWPHLRPEFESTVSPSTYLNRLSLADWRLMFQEIMPGVQFVNEARHADRRFRGRGDRR